MTLRGTGAGMPEAKKGQRHLKTHMRLPIPGASLAVHGSRAAIDRQARAAS